MSELATLRAVFREVRRSILEAVEGIAEGEAWRPGPAIHPDDSGTYRTGMSEEDLNWSPGDGISSVSSLLVHTLSSQRYWICGVVGGEPVTRNRESEFRNETKSKTAVTAAYRAAGAEVDRILERLGGEDLDRQVGTGATVREILLDVIVHSSHHRGQILLLKHLRQTQNGLNPSAPSL